MSQNILSPKVFHMSDWEQVACDVSYPFQVDLSLSRWGPRSRQALHWLSCRNLGDGPRTRKRRDVPTEDTHKVRTGRIFRSKPVPCPIPCIGWVSPHKERLRQQYRTGNRAAWLLTSRACVSEAPSSRPAWGHLSVEGTRAVHTLVRMQARHGHPTLFFLPAQPKQTRCWAPTLQGAPTALAVLCLLSMDANLHGPCPCLVGEGNCGPNEREGSGKEATVQEGFWAGTPEEMGKWMRALKTRHCPRVSQPRLNMRIAEGIFTKCWCLEPT